MEKFKINVAISSPKSFIKAAFIWTNIHEEYEFLEQVNKESISLYNNKGCRIFHTISGIPVVDKWYTHGVIVDSDEFQTFLEKNGI